MIVDLVSPWLVALESSDSHVARATFLQRHASMFTHPEDDSVTRGLVTDVRALRPLARRAADPALHETLRQTAHRAADFGADSCQVVALVAREEGHDALRTVASPDPAVVLSIAHVDDDDATRIALARGIATLTRQLASDSRAHPRLREAPTLPSWEVARDVPLREWIYDAGVGLHLASALAPTLAPHTLLGIHQSALNRIRERENALRLLLDADLDERGIGLLLRWLAPHAAPGPRTVGDTVIPPMAGQYLGWRLTAERVERLGIARALREEA